MFGPRDGDVVPLYCFRMKCMRLKDLKGNVAHVTLPKDSMTGETQLVQPQWATNATFEDTILALFVFRNN